MTTTAVVIVGVWLELQILRFILLGPWLYERTGHFSLTGWWLVSKRRMYYANKVDRQHRRQARHQDHADPFADSIRDTLTAGQRDPDGTGRDTAQASTGHRVVEAPPRIVW